MGYSGVFLFLIGAALGSFINVLSLRYAPGERIFQGKIGGRSHCPSCGKKLVWYELIPIASFIIQKGRCRSCGARLAWQYPVVELATGFALAFVPRAVFSAYQLQYFPGDGLPLWFYFLAASFSLSALTLIFLSAVDIRLSIIPDQSNVLLALAGIAVAAVKARYGFIGLRGGSFLGHYSALFGFEESVWMNHLFAAVAGIAFFGLIALFTRGRGMGMGDVKLAGALGLLLGWPDAGLAILLAFIIGAFFGILFIVKKAKHLKSAVPFGPYLALGAFAVLFFGKEILDGYFRLFP